MVVRAAAAPAVVLAVLVLAGCGGGGESRRDVVAAYITNVNAVEAKLQAPVGTATRASYGLTQKGADPEATAAKLRTAATRIDRLRARLAAIASPPEARRLRALLLEQTDEEAALAREVAALAAFLPTYAAALRPLDPARAELKQALAKRGPVDAKAKALDAYAAAAGAAIARLRRVHPPPVAAPVHRTQIATLVHVRASATGLARALRARRAARIPKLVHRFQQAALGNQSLAAQRARIAAVRAYNARVRGLDALLPRIERERSRLQKRLA